MERKGEPKKTAQESEDHITAARRQVDASGLIVEIKSKFVDYRFAWIADLERSLLVPLKT